MKKLLRILLKIVKGLAITILAIAVLIGVADALWIYVPQWKASTKIEEVADYAKSLDEINVRQDARVIAIGEATHGNADFQTIKLEVLKQMVENNGARSFSLEVDFGDGMVVNDYIQGYSEIKDSKELLPYLSFNIYQTEEVKEMIDWMKEYNEGLSDDQKLSFYGFDMQVNTNGKEMLKNFCQENGIETADDVTEDLDNIARELVAKKDELENVRNYDLMVREVEILKQTNEYSDCNFDDYISTNNVRDNYMADNVEWIEAYEKSKGFDKIVIAGHNGHVQKKAQFYSSMGSHLAEYYGKEYFVISTDYYHTSCNINISGPDNSRGIYKFCSADPLAKQAKYYGGSYYLNFDEVDADSTVMDIISNPMTMGSLGEGYSLMMSFLPTSHRVNLVPNELGDAMIFVYQAEPFTMVE